MIIGGCTKEERFVSEVTCLDPLRRSRLEVAKLPITEMEVESDNKKWVEFACVTFRNEVYISGEYSRAYAHMHKDIAQPAPPRRGSVATCTSPSSPTTIAVEALYSNLNSLDRLEPFVNV